MKKLIITRSVFLINIISLTVQVQESFVFGAETKNSNQSVSEKTTPAMSITRISTAVNGKAGSSTPTSTINSELAQSAASVLSSTATVQVANNFTQTSITATPLVATPSNSSTSTVTEAKSNKMPETATATADFVIDSTELTSPNSTLIATSPTSTLATTSTESTTSVVSPSTAAVSVEIKSADILPTTASESPIKSTSISIITESATATALMESLVTKTIPAWKVAKNREAWILICNAVGSFKDVNTELLSFDMGGSIWKRCHSLNQELNNNATSKTPPSAAAITLATVSVKSDEHVWTSVCKAVGLFKRKKMKKSFNTNWALQNSEDPDASLIWSRCQLLNEQLKNNTTSEATVSSAFVSFATEPVTKNATTVDNQPRSTETLSPLTTNVSSLSINLNPVEKKSTDTLPTTTVKNTTTSAAMASSALVSFATEPAKKNITPVLDTPNRINIQGHSFRKLILRKLERRLDKWRHADDRDDELIKGLCDLLPGLCSNSTTASVNRTSSTETLTTLTTNESSVSIASNSKAAHQVEINSTFTLSTTTSEPSTKTEPVLNDREAWTLICKAAGLYKTTINYDTANLKLSSDLVGRNDMILNRCRFLNQLIANNSTWEEAISESINSSAIVPVTTPTTPTTTTPDTLVWQSICKAVGLFKTEITENDFNTKWGLQNSEDPAAILIWSRCVLVNRQMTIASTSTVADTVEQKTTDTLPTTISEPSTEIVPVFNKREAWILICKAAGLYKITTNPANISKFSDLLESDGFIWRHCNSLNQHLADNSTWEEPILAPVNSLTTAPETTPTATTPHFSSRSVWESVCETLDFLSIKKAENGLNTNWALQYSKDPATHFIWSKCRLLNQLPTNELTTQSTPAYESTTSLNAHQLLQLISRQIQDPDWLPPPHPLQIQQRLLNPSEPTAASITAPTTTITSLSGAETFLPLVVREWQRLQWQRVQEKEKEKNATLIQQSLTFSTQVPQLQLQPQGSQLYQLLNPQPPTRQLQLPNEQQQQLKNREFIPVLLLPHQLLLQPEPQQQPQTSEPQSQQNLRRLLELSALQPQPERQQQPLNPQTKQQQQLPLHLQPEQQQELRTKIQQHDPHLLQALHSYLQPEQQQPQSSPAVLQQQLQLQQQQQRLSPSVPQQQQLLPVQPAPLQLQSAPPVQQGTFQSSNLVPLPESQSFLSQPIQHQLQPERPLSSPLNQQQPLLFQQTQAQQQPQQQLQPQQQQQQLLSPPLNQQQQQPLLFQQTQAQQQPQQQLQPQQQQQQLLSPPLNQQQQQPLLFQQTQAQQQPLQQERPPSSSVLNQAYPTLSIQLQLHKGGQISSDQSIQNLQHPLQQIKLPQPSQVQWHPQQHNIPSSSLPSQQNQQLSLQSPQALLPTEQFVPSSASQPRQENLFVSPGPLNYAQRIQYVPGFRGNTRS